MTLRSSGVRQDGNGLCSDSVLNAFSDILSSLAVIHLYAETLELDRITTSERRQEYYRTIRRESESLAAKIERIMDISTSHKTDGDEEKCGASG